MTKEHLVEVLSDYLGVDCGDPYIYELTRDKRAFEIGTMTLYDFEEVGKQFVEDLANVILDVFAK